MRTQQNVLGAVERDLRDAGFPPLAWYDVLLELRRADKGLRPVDLEKRLLIAQYNLSRLIDRLEKAGYLARRACPGDGRSHTLVLRPDGKKLLARMWPAYASAIQTHIGDRLSGPQAKTLADLLARLE